MIIIRNGTAKKEPTTCLLATHVVIFTPWEKRAGFKVTDNGTCIIYIQIFGMHVFLSQPYHSYVVLHFLPPSFPCFFLSFFNLFLPFPYSLLLLVFGCLCSVYLSKYVLGLQSSVGNTHSHKPLRVV